MLVEERFGSATFGSGFFGMPVPYAENLIRRVVLTLQVIEPQLALAVGEVAIRSSVSAGRSMATSVGNIQIALQPVEVF